MEAEPAPQVEQRGAGASEAEAAADGVQPSSEQPSTAAEASGADNSANGSGGKKRKVAMYLAYVGHGFQGMQRNPGARTIEDELFRALHAAGAISDANSDDHGFIKVHWMRAARTDKGVSAVGQVVSLKMVMEPEEGMLDRINAALPSQIRVFGYSRTTNGFDSRKHCDKRRYEYILPEWAFDPRRGLGRTALAAAAAAAEDAGVDGGGPGGEESEEAEVEAAQGVTELLQQVEQQKQGQQQGQEAGAAGAAAAGSAAGGAGGDGGAVQAMAVDGGGAAGIEQPPAVQQGEGEDATEPAAGAGAAGAAGAGAAQAAAAGDGDSVAAQAASPGGAVDGAAAAAEGPFVFDEARVQRLTQILSNYEGTHNFHNFTVRKPATAPDVKRYILSFRCKGMFEVNGQRWVRMVVVGQSFMLHQIRKMVGMAVAVMRGTAPEECLKLALKSSADLNTPMAPELGLFLDECFFDAYNSQWAHLHTELRLSDYQAEVDAFKAQEVYPHIAARDAEEGVNEAWLKTLNEANYKFKHWKERVDSIRQGGGRRAPPPRKGEGAAAVVGGMERYGQRELLDSKRRRSSGGGRGGGGSSGGGDGDGKRARPSFGGRQGRVLPPPEQRGGAGGRGASAAAAHMATGEYSD